MANIFCEEGWPPARPTPNRATELIAAALGIDRTPNAILQDLVWDRLYKSATKHAHDEAIVEEDDIAAAVGQWVIDKYRAAAKERGYQAVARQLRKQGVPIEIAKLILLGVQP
jgi:hypothetical protein